MERELGRDIARRSFVRTAAALGLTGGIAGCTDSIPDSLNGGRSQGQTGPVETFVRGYQQDDPELARSAIHPESPIYDQGSDEAVRRTNLEIQSATVVSEDRGILRVKLLMSNEDNAGREQVFTFWIRPHEGEPKIWQIMTGPPSENDLSTPTDEGTPMETEEPADEETETEPEEPQETPTDALFYEGFEDGVERWDATADRWGQTSAVAYSGEYSAAIGTNTQVSALASADIGSGTRISEFSYYWQETSRSYGGGVQLFNSAGEVEIGTASDNPEWIVDDAEGIRPVASGTGYNRWIRTELVFDWGRGTVEVTFRDTETGDGYSQTHALKQGRDVQRIQLTAFTSERDWKNDSCYMSWDDIVVE
jgi:hypothetical protein